MKVVKNKAYFKRYQVKFRRRRGIVKFPVICNSVSSVNIPIILTYVFHTITVAFQREKRITMLGNVW